MLACDGFEANQAMREQYLPKPTRAEWSAAPPVNTGDGIRAGRVIATRRSQFARPSDAGCKREDLPRSR
ncbi:hypothetical protein [Paraburkholderia translucens]|uniref:hypothetical protein n=1 Tax=Paraburkholderia translucens TaxID=2886945 RepID=UPI003CE4DC7D